MPHVIVKLYPGRSEQQKAQLAEKITQDVVAEVIGDLHLVIVARPPLLRYGIPALTLTGVGCPVVEQVDVRTGLEHLHHDLSAGRPVPHAFAVLLAVTPPRVAVGLRYLDDIARAHKYVGTTSIIGTRSRVLSVGADEDVNATIVVHIPR